MFKHYEWEFGDPAPGPITELGVCMQAWMALGAPGKFQDFSHMMKTDLTARTEILAFVNTTREL